MLFNKHYIALSCDINYAVVAVHTDRAGIHNIQAVEVFGILIMSVTEKDYIGRKLDKKVFKKSVQ